MTIQIGVPKEVREGEQRVALIPDVVKRLMDTGLSVAVEAGAGEAAGYRDADYANCAKSGADAAAEAPTVQIIPDADTLLQTADITLLVNPITPPQAERLKEGSILIGHLSPHTDPERFTTLARRNISAFAMELIPRISRAQAMDTLSSQASVAGYKAVLMAADLLGKFFPMLTTAAGTIRPSKVLVIGAGVAGLQAIATARRLGAIVEGYDVRAAVKEQVESLGARFVDMEIKAEGEGGYARELTAAERERQAGVLARHVAGADVIVSTAAIPGRPAPRIITAAMVEAMRGGSVIVDLAAESGGNCELTRPGETVVHEAVKIHGPVNVPATVANHASELYARNLLSFLQLLIKDGRPVIDLEDEIINESLITHAGAVHNPQLRERLSAPSQPTQQPQPTGGSS